MIVHAAATGGQWRAVLADQNITAPNLLDLRDRLRELVEDGEAIEVRVVASSQLPAAPA